MMSSAVLSAVAYGSSHLKPLNAASAAKEPQESLPQTLEVVDRLYDANKMVEALAYLEKHRESTEAEILWRLARLCYKVGKYHIRSEEAPEMADKAVAYIERALEADSENFACHKWSGIIISWSSEFKGTRSKIERSFDVRENFQRAIELNPRDPTSRHLMGQWCYSVASVPWYQKKIAAVVFATPPYSTYEEALDHFEEAENIQPGFYSTNWLYIGKCYLQLGRVQEGGVWLKKAAAHISDVQEDIDTRQEAEQLLKKLSIK